MNRWILAVAIVVAFLFAGAAVLFLPGLDKFFTSTQSKQEQQSLEEANKLQTSKLDQKPSTPLERRTQAPPGPGWALNCASQANQKDFECGISQTVVTKQGRRVLANVTVRVPPDTTTPEMRIQLPLLVYLPAGISYQIDENAPRLLEFRACLRDGCYGQTSVAPEVLAALKKGDQLILTFQNMAQKKISLSLSLAGFGETYAKIKSRS
jgi:invasion protein IalB